MSAHSVIIYIPLLMLDTQSSDTGYTVVVISLLSLGTFVEAVVWTHKSTIKPYVYTCNPTIIICILLAW